jgi:hypothetical protein
LQICEARKTLLRADQDACDFAWPHPRGTPGLVAAEDAEPRLRLAAAGIAANHLRVAQAARRANFSGRVFDAEMKRCKAEKRTIKAAAAARFEGDKNCASMRSRARDQRANHAPIRARKSRFEERLMCVGRVRRKKK